MEASALLTHRRCVCVCVCVCRQARNTMQCVLGEGEGVKCAHVNRNKLQFYSIFSCIYSCIASSCKQVLN